MQRISSSKRFTDGTELMTPHKRGLHILNPAPMRCSTGPGIFKQRYKPANLLLAAGNPWLMHGAGLCGAMSTGGSQIRCPKQPRLHREAGQAGRDGPCHSWQLGQDQQPSTPPKPWKNYNCFHAGYTTRAATPKRC